MYSFHCEIVLGRWVDLLTSLCSVYYDVGRWVIYLFTGAFIVAYWILCILLHVSNGKITWLRIVCVLPPKDLTSLAARLILLLLLVWIVYWFDLLWWTWNVIHRENCELKECSYWATALLLGVQNLMCTCIQSHCVECVLNFIGLNLMFKFDVVRWFLIYMFHVWTCWNLIAVALDLLELCCGWSWARRILHHSEDSPLQIKPRWA